MRFIRVVKSDGSSPFAPKDLAIILPTEKNQVFTAKDIYVFEMAGLRRRMQPFVNFFKRKNMLALEIHAVGRFDVEEPHSGNRQLSSVRTSGDFRIVNVQAVSSMKWS